MNRSKRFLRPLDLVILVEMSLAWWHPARVFYFFESFFVEVVKCLRVIFDVFSDTHCDEMSVSYISWTTFLKRRKATSGIIDTHFELLPLSCLIGKKCREKDRGCNTSQVKWAIQCISVSVKKSTLRSESPIEKSCHKKPVIATIPEKNSLPFLFGLEEF